MKHKSAITLLGTACVLFACVPLFAHHGTAAYDLQNTIVLKGTVTNFIWANPHIQLFFDVKDDNGTIAHWACEATGPGRLSRSGWTSHAVKPGDQIVVTIGPAKSGAHLGILRKLVANGKTYSPDVDETPY